MGCLSDLVLEMDAPGNGLLRLIYRSEIPIKQQYVLQIKVSWDSWDHNDQSFSKVCVFSEFDPPTQSVFKSFHSGERFKKFAFSSKTRTHCFHHFRVDGTWKHNKMLAFLNENAFVWTGLDVSTKKNNGLCQPIIHQSLFSLVMILSFFNRCFNWKPNLCCRLILF